MRMAKEVFRFISGESQHEPIGDKDMKKVIHDEGFSVKG